MNKFIPKNYTYSKLRKRLKFKNTKEIKHINLKIGTIGLKTIESGVITATILEATRRTIARRIKKIGKMLFFVHPNVPLTKKPVGVRMGKGSGSLSVWVSPIKKGKVILELVNVPISVGNLTLKAVSHKLPFKTKIIYK